MAELPRRRGAGPAAGHDQPAAHGRPGDRRHRPAVARARSEQLDGPYSHTYSDVDDDNVAGRGRDRAAHARRGDFDYPFTEFGEPDGYDDACDFTTPDEGWPDPLSPSVLLRVGPDRSDLVADQPRAERRPGLLPRQLLPRPPREPEHRLRRRHRRLRRRRHGRAGRPGVTETDDGAASARTAARTATTSTTRTCPRRPTATARGCRCTCSRYDPDPGFLTFRNMNGGDDAGDRLARVHARPLEPPGRQRRRVRRPLRAARRARWARRGATGTRSTCCTATGLEIDDPDVAGEVDIGLSRDAALHLDALRADRLPGRLDVAALPRRHRDRPRGGYTFGDFGKVNGAPEVHSDGEIWMQTLWDLRDALVRLAERAGGLRPRRGARHRGHAAVAARAVVPGHAQRDPRGRDRSIRRHARDLVWAVFAGRGMGFFAGARRRQRRRRRVEDFSHAARRGRPEGRRGGTVDLGRHRAAAGGRAGRLRRPHRATRRSRTTSRPDRAMTAATR